MVAALKNEQEAQRVLLEKIESEVQRLHQQSGSVQTSIDPGEKLVRSEVRNMPQFYSESKRIQALENEVAALKLRMRSSAMAGVVEYDPEQPAEEPLEQVESEAASWGPEQLVGPPDVPKAGDDRHAWASKETDAGPEWLHLEFQTAVEVAEVRIRENYNAGAISKVTALVDGQEIVLWEGQAAISKRLRDFVVRPKFPVVSKSIMVHLDTARVPG
jgi:hypothetical protein